MKPANINAVLSGKPGNWRSATTAIGDLGPRPVHGSLLNSAIWFEYFLNSAIRLLANSAMTLKNSTGDLIVASSTE
jgi:hypothetical protein